MFPAPGDSFLQGFSGAAGPEDELVAGSFLIDQIFYQRSVGFAEFRLHIITREKLKEYFPVFYTKSQMEKVLFDLLGEWKKMNVQ